MVVGYTKGTWESLKCMHHLELSSRNSLFPFPSPGGFGVGVGRKVGADLSSSMGWLSVGGILLLVVLVDCLFLYGVLMR